jgi:hypothetical protein
LPRNEAAKPYFLGRFHGIDKIRLHCTRFWGHH